MNNRKLAIIIGAVGALVLFGNRFKRLYDGIKYAVKNLRFVNLDLSSGNISLAFDFAVYNPSLLSVNIESLDGVVLLQNQQIGFVNMPVGRELRAKEETTIPVLVNVLSTDAIAQVINLLSYSTMQQWIITLRGTLRVNSHDIDIVYNYPMSNL
ncbi:MAG: LEA type 2 family protein [Methanobrevibacter sp.]|nr:LEA type 2 family protein [Methanobrevibacter sp.]